MPISEKEKKGLNHDLLNMISEVEPLQAHLREIRKRGYAFSDQEVDRDVRAVAGPILNGLGELVAGLSVAGPAYRMNKKKINDLRRLVVEYAQRISIQLGCKLKQ